jgi:hypothetical protein
MAVIGDQSWFSLQSVHVEAGVGRSTCSIDPPQSEASQGLMCDRVSWAPADQNAPGEEPMGGRLPAPSSALGHDEAIIISADPGVFFRRHRRRVEPPRASHQALWR